MSSASSRQRLDILNKLGALFDDQGLNPSGNSIIHFDHVLKKQRELTDIKDRIGREMAAARNAEDHLNLENTDKLEPTTAATILNQSSITEDSEMRAANSYLLEAALCPTIVHERHM